jgi:hypothetical protein
MRGFVGAEKDSTQSDEPSTGECRPGGKIPGRWHLTTPSGPWHRSSLIDRPAMDPEAEFIRSEIPAVENIIRAECWLEAERRGRPVDPSDSVVQSRVADIILDGAGAALRKTRGEKEK